MDLGIFACAPASDTFHLPQLAPPVINTDCQAPTTELYMSNLSNKIEEQSNKLHTN